MTGNKLSAQPIRFALSGGLATTSHWGSMAFMVSMGALPATATAIGALIGAAINYALQRSITFQSNTPHGATILRYLGACTLIWLANLVLFLVLHHTTQLSPLFAQGITTFTLAFMSYFLFKRIVFNDHQSSSA